MVFMGPPALPMWAKAFMWRTVAAILEFGAPKASIPERPFFRQSVAIMENGLPHFLSGIIDPATMEVGDREANEVGAWAADIIYRTASWN